MSSLALFLPRLCVISLYPHPSSQSPLTAHWNPRHNQSWNSQCVFYNAPQTQPAPLAATFPLVKSVIFNLNGLLYHIESTLLIELTFQRRKSEGGCSEFLDRLLSVGLLEEEKNSSILWLLKHSYWSKVSLAVQNSSIGDLVTHSLTVLLLLTYKEQP